MKKKIRYLRKFCLYIVSSILVSFFILMIYPSSFSAYAAEQEGTGKEKTVQEEAEEGAVQEETKQEGAVQEDAEQENNQGNWSQEIDYDQAYGEIYEMLGLEEVEQKLRENQITEELDFSDLVRGVFRGDTSMVKNNLWKVVKNTFVGELAQNRSLMLQLVSIVLLGSIFVNLATSFGNGFVSENGFYVTYLIITSLLLTSFSVSLDMVSATIEKILVLIRIIVPVYALAMNFVGHAVSSMGMYQVILVGVWLVQVVILRLILPMIKFFVIVSLVNNLNREDSFSKMCELIKNLVSWMLKTIIVFIAGLNIIKSLIEPQIDALGKNTVNRIMAAIPGGGILSVLTGTFLGAGLVIKNSIGVAGIIFLIFIVMIPVIKAFLMMLMVKITAVLIQPVGEKRYVDGIEALSQGIFLLLQTLGSSIVLFMLTIAIMAYASSG